jgi:hypothetical protein
VAVETAADRAVFFDVDDFGVAATYRRGVTNSTVNGIFDNEFVQVTVGEVPYDSTEPVFVCQTSSLPTGYTVGDRLTVSGVYYTIREFQPDGTGMHKLRLEAQT